MFAKVLIGVALGGLLGVALGPLARCESGTCPLLRRNVTRILFGAFVGGYLAYGLSCKPLVRDTYRSERVVRVKTEQEFNEKVLQQTDKPVLVDFYADRCPACRIQGPVIEHMADELADSAVVAKVHTNKLSRLSMRYGIRYIPTLIVFYNGTEVTRKSGVHDKARIRKLISQAKRK